jgi:O-antigen ligase
MGQIRTIFQPLIAKFSKLVPHQLEQQPPSLLFWLSALTFVCCVILGGGTRNGFLSDAILQLLAIPLLLVALWQLQIVSVSKQPKSAQLKFALAFCLAIALLPLVQLIPLPPWIWTALPGHQPVESVFDVLGHALPWMPISVVPYQTWGSALSLIPPIAVFLGTVLLSYHERRLMTLVVLSIGFVSVFLGLFQVAQGPESSLRFFEFTNKEVVVGFFANRNHFSAFLYSIFVFAGAWAIYAISTSTSLRDQRTRSAVWIVPTVLLFLFMIVILSAQAMTRSRAGLIITMVAVFGIFALAYFQRRESRTMTTRLLLATVIIAVGFIVQFGLYRIMERFSFDPLEDTRIPIAHVTIEALKAFMPFGSGMGSFIPVYDTYQKPRDLLIYAFVNRAHDDFLELGLEAGAAGALLLGVFLVWLVVRSIKIWRRAPFGANEIDHSLVRAATIIISLLLVNSLTDYPLRTAALMAIMAFSCALLIVPIQAAEIHVPLPARNTRSSGHRSGPANSPAVAVASAPPMTSNRRWGEGIDWPEEWRKPEKGDSPNAAGSPPRSNKPTSE